MSHSFHHSFFTPRVMIDRRSSPSSRRAPDAGHFKQRVRPGPTAPARMRARHRPQTPAVPAPTDACKQLSSRAARGTLRASARARASPARHRSRSACGSSRGLPDARARATRPHGAAREAEQLDHAPVRWASSSQAFSRREPLRGVDLLDQPPLRQPAQQMRGLALIGDAGGGRDLTVARARRTRDRAEHQRRAVGDRDR